ncbi:hypothetical protein F53441_3849 [Fusarium austroafricanum]|uniref:RRM domain-containing protein n=1 Tax=Fusarium austroafricanum TaxID=2364996 RepID=A0A8H4KNI0_9HYPO|nr:hypothetical protein F53441_3849 [Fusarium austroafricanum]
MSAEAAAASSDYIRLHISPLDPELLKIVLPASAAPKARNISYHTIETFPERRYGFVELPTMEADKLKKKLNGAVLKGNKIRIEKARPEERVEPTGEDHKEEEEKSKKKKKKSKESKEESRKRKRDPDVVEGVALTDRKVKRGWTEPADQRRKKSKQDKEKEKDGKHTEKKKRLKSKYTDGDECLLKTKIPPNAIANLPEDDQPRKRKKKGKSREVVVHEFEKTTKFPSFLKNSVAEGEVNAATEFVEGKGWVDEDGNVVETVKEKKAPEPAPKKKKVKKTTPPPVEESDDDTSSSGTSSSGSSDEDSEDEMEVDVQEKKEEVVKDTLNDAPQTDDESSSSNPDSPKQPQQTTPLSAIKADDTRPMSSSSTRSLTIKIPPPATSSTKVHPLEALYKRAKPDEVTTETPAKKEAEPFSFFGAGDNDDDIEDEEDQDPANQTIATPAPMTPFSRQDFEWRNVRSAAPTPDTAHPSRMRNFWPEDEEEGEEGADMAELGFDEDGDEKDASAPQSSSDFQAWFWDNRRDLNRSWMKRRKTAAKEKRHRENKARASKAV